MSPGHAANEYKLAGNLMSTNRNLKIFVTLELGFWNRKISEKRDSVT